MKNFNLLSRLERWVKGLSSCIRPVGVSYGASGARVVPNIRPTYALHTLKYAAVLVLLLCLGVGNAWGDSSYTWTCTSGTLSTSAAALAGASSNSILWEASQTGASQGTGVSGEKCVQFAKNTTLTLTTSSIPGTISSITLQTWGSDGNSITCSVGESYSNNNETIPTSYSSSGSEVTWNNINASGTITFSWGSANKAFNLRKISITYISCSNTVTPAEGTKTNVSTISFSPASVATCSSTASDRQVTVTVTPASCYSVPSSTRLYVTGTSASYVSGPTDNGNGTYSFVYQFAQNATGKSTFAASLDTKTTYTVQYDAGSTTHTGGNAISGSHANDTKTCGTTLTLPGVVFTTTGYTQTGWAKTNGGTKTNNLNGSYTSDAAQTFYPFWTANEYTVTWKVNGANYSAGGATSVNYGSRVSTLPTAPDPGDYCGDKFMGWTTDAVYVHGTSPLFTTAGSAPEVSAEGDITYYAVFADYAE